MPISVCPSCQAAMRVVTHGEIFVDVCTSCRGVWLDAGELASIIAATRDDEAARRAAAAPQPTPTPRSTPTRERRRGGDDDRRDKRRRKKTRRRGSWLEDLGDLLEDILD